MKNILTESTGEFSEGCDYHDTELEHWPWIQSGKVQNISSISYYKKLNQIQNQNRSVPTVIKLGRCENKLFFILWVQERERRQQH
jgi:TnpA family transposase